ncbi:hypothetical protein P170DRAFT_178117 [Aspergillus steynii IBT 23096]|uniref:Uncharacterized protein n=1 Tax=Aspergillus steynii IBT 23096 TaxID=1392250 RepID=A0A2I2G8L8_9EURO|nr:uncharacterized protein P170DRAFT_178117 [Aspergillus steynii IBT 23096]PLB49232.1 hypothetical protein P170DRAFT_178117 [Aspergillus steynii IBT 23096]
MTCHLLARVLKLQDEPSQFKPQLNQTGTASLFIFRRNQATKSKPLSGPRPWNRTRNRVDTRRDTNECRRMSQNLVKLQDESSTQNESSRKDAAPSVNSVQRSFYASKKEKVKGKHVMHGGQLWTFEVVMSKMTIRICRVELPCSPSLRVRERERDWEREKGKRNTTCKRNPHTQRARPLQSRERKT